MTIEEYTCNHCDTPKAPHIRGVCLLCQEIELTVEEESEFWGYINADGESQDDPD